MSTVKRVVRNTGFLYAKMGISMFISLYSTRVILNSLGASDFGIYNIVGGAIAMLGFLNAAMTSATQRFMSYSEGERNKDKLKKIFNISIILHFVLAIIILVILFIAGYFFFDGILKIDSSRISAAKIIYLSFIFSTIFTVMSVPYDALLNAHENMLFYAILGVLEAFLKLGVALSISYFEVDRLILYGILMTLVPIITLTIMRFYCHNKYDECRISPLKYWDNQLMKEMTKFAGWNLIGAASGMISQYGLSIVLNNFFGTLLNAAQGIANQISGQLMVFSNTMMKAVNPIIAKSEGGGKRELMLQTSMVGSRFSFLLLALFAIPFLIETPFILKIWLENIPPWTIIFTRLQLIRSLIEQLTIMLGAAIAAQGDIERFTKLKSILNALPICLTYLFFTYNFPPYVLYLVWILCGGVIGGSLTVYFTRIKCGLSYLDFFKLVLTPCIGVSILMLGAGYSMTLIMNESFIRLIVLSLITTTVFFLSYICFFSTVIERVFIIDIFKRFTKIKR